MSVNRMTTWAVVMVVVGAGLGGGVGCVQTSECNASVQCGEGEVCYDYVCRDICAGPASCETSESCASCEDPETDENLCFGRTERACIPDEQQPGGSSEDATIVDGVSGLDGSSRLDGMDR